MAIRGHPCGFELPRRDDFGFTGMGQDIWETIYGRISQPNTTRRHSGNKSVLLDSSDALYMVTGQVEPFSGSATLKWWTGFHSPKEFMIPFATDVIFISQLTDWIDRVNTKFLALTGLVSYTAPTYYFQYRLSIVTVDGSGNKSFEHLITDGTTGGTGKINPLAVGNNDWYMWTVEYDDNVGPYGGVRLFVGLNSTAMYVGGPLALTSAQKAFLLLNAYQCPDTRTAAGKGGSLLGAYFDDLICNDDQDGGLITRPTFDIGTLGLPVSGGVVPEVTGTVYGAAVALSGTTFKAGLSGMLLDYTDADNGDSSGGSPYYGRHFARTPEITPRNWTTALFNDLSTSSAVENINVVGLDLALAPSAAFVPRVVVY